MEIVSQPVAERRTGAQRLHFLDFIRGLAAIAVCFEHAGYRVFTDFRTLTHQYFSFGKFGVSVFFLTSGFVIPLSLERGNSLARFWISRFFRLYPLYWFSLAMAVALLSFGVTDAVTDTFVAHPVKYALVNLTMFQSLVGVPDAIGLYYTLAMEMGFYIAFSFLFRLRLNHRSILFAWCASISLALAGTLAPLFLHRRLPFAGMFYLMCLAVGTALYRHFTGEASTRQLQALFAFLLVSTPVEVYCNYVLVQKGDALEIYTLCAALAPWLLALLVFPGAYVYRSIRFPRGFVWLGSISYSVYLVHPLIQVLMPVRQNSFLSLLAMVTGPVLFSILTYNLIEKPGIAMGKRVFRMMVASAPMVSERGAGPHAEVLSPGRIAAEDGSTAVDPLRLQGDKQHGAIA